MSELADNLKRLKYDKRMINWNLRQKVVTEEEYQKHAQEQPDLSHLKDTMEEPQGESDQS